MDSQYMKKVAKRKRSEVDLASKITGKLNKHHELKEVRKAAKKAKSFEIQKLVKRLKQLRAKDEQSEEITETEAQLIAMKHANHEAIANSAMKTKLTKDRELHGNEHIQITIDKELSENLIIPSIPGTPAAKMESRLLSSKYLSAQVAAAIENLKATLHPDAEIHKHGNPGISSGNESMLSIQASAQAEIDSAKTDEEESLQMEVDREGWESGTVGDDEKESADGSEHGSLIKDTLDSYRGDRSTLIDDASSNDSLDHEDRPVKKRSESGTHATTGTRSVFLPSLSVGYIRGGSSNSDVSDREAELAELGQKKNRRGQRARRTIWEKKYGKNANHKKKEMFSAATSGYRWRKSDAHGLAHDQTSRTDFRAKKKLKPRQSLENDSAGNSVQGSVTVSRAARPSVLFLPKTQSNKAQEERPLHPSWEAKRKLKEKQSAAILPSQSSKIIFS